MLDINKYSHMNGGMHTHMVLVFNGIDCIENASTIRLSLQVINKDIWDRLLFLENESKMRQPYVCARRKHMFEDDGKQNISSDEERE